MSVGKVFSVFAAAAGISIGVAVFIEPKLEPPAPPPPVEERQTRPAPNLSNAAVLKREANGHYWAQANVDGTAVKFLVDTGASTVALTYRDAQRLGLKPEDLDYSWSISTAGGETFGASVILGSIKVGGVEVENVEAMILRDGLQQSLLGMTFLGELYSYEFRGNNLIIRQ